MSDKTLELCADVAFVGYAAAKREIEQLRAKNAELAAEVERWKTISVCEACAELPAVFQYIEGMEKQLASAEEHNARLKDALRHCCYSLAQVTGPAKMSCDYARWKADQALSIPASRETLDAYVAEKVKELEADRNDCLALANSNFAKLIELTRQRDLAVSALEELTGVWYGKAVSDIALKALSTLKESEV